MSGIENRESTGSAVGLGRARIAVVQYDLKRITSFEDFAQQCSIFVKTAADYKSDFILFPELFTTQLLTFLDGDMATVARKLSDMTPRYLKLFEELSRSTKTYIIAGSQLCFEDGRLHNISYFFDREGNYQKQYKIHVTPHEKNVWGVEPGHAVQVFDTDKGKIAILICYDIEFPELCRMAASKGARIMFVPSNTDQRFGYLRVRYCAQARCIENQVYVAISGCIGTTPMLGSGEIHYSKGAIFTPSDLPFAQDGIAAECEANIETMIIQDVDLDTLDHHRNSGSVRPWHDRRTDIYNVVFRHSEHEELV